MTGGESSVGSILELPANPRRCDAPRLFRVADRTQHLEAPSGKAVFPAGRGFLPHHCFLSELPLHQNGAILFYVNGVGQCIRFQKTFTLIFWFCSIGTRTQDFVHLGQVPCP